MRRLTPEQQQEITEIREKYGVKAVSVYKTWDCTNCGALLEPRAICWSPKPNKHYCTNCIETVKGKSEVSKAVRKRVHAFYDTAEECAAIAAPLFKSKRWIWTNIDVPSEQQILEKLRYLERSAKEEGRDFGATGRLIYEFGKFGHHTR